MNQELKDFIEANIDLIEQGDMRKVYSLRDSYHRSELTDVLMSAGINVFEQMTIVPNGFAKGLDIQTIEIPEPIKRIDNYAFKGSNIESITLPNTLQQLGYEVFSFFSKLNSLVIPDSVTHIDDSAFLSCSSLESVKLSNSLELISPYLFKQCMYLKHVSIPASVLSIGSNAFSMCYELETINYEGTRNQWHKVHKDYKWAVGASISAVICTDGVIQINPV